VQNGKKKGREKGQEEADRTTDEIRIGNNRRRFGRIVVSKVRFKIRIQNSKVFGVLAQVVVVKFGKLSTNAVGPGLEGRGKGIESNRGSSNNQDK
jgi:hypothetical protein